MSREEYSKLAQAMATHEELGIPRRFRKLGMQNLLYLQAELTYLEEDLENLANRDAGYQGRARHTKDWYSLAQWYDQIEDHSESEVEDSMRTKKGKGYAGKQDITKSSEGGGGSRDGVENDRKYNELKFEGEDEEEDFDKDREQWEKALQIREKLREYCKFTLFLIFTHLS